MSVSFRLQYGLNLFWGCRQLTFWGSYLNKKNKAVLWMAKVVTEFWIRKLSFGLASRPSAFYCYKPYCATLAKADKRYVRILIQGPPQKKHGCTLLKNPQATAINNTPSSFEPLRRNPQHRESLSCRMPGRSSCRSECNPRRSGGRLKNSAEGWDVGVSLNYCSQNGEIYIGPCIIIGT